MPEDISKPVALVTGGAQRVGRAICKELSKQGYRVAVHANTSIDEAQTLADELGNAKAYQAKLNNEEEARGLIDSVSQDFGQLNLLVNCAAIWQPKPFREVTAEDLRKYYEVNTVASFVCSQQAGGIMAQQGGGGSILLFGDVAMQHPQPDYAAYHPSKGAIPTMTRSLAVELAKLNGKIRVNAILPGPVLISDDEPAERLAAVTEGPLLTTVGRAEHLAQAAIMLAENAFITGECLAVDGGRSIVGS